MARLIRALTVAGAVAYIGLAVAGEGSFERFASRASASCAGGRHDLLSVAALFTEGNLSTGLRRIVATAGCLFRSASWPAAGLYSRADRSAERSDDRHGPRDGSASRCLRPAARCASRPCSPSVHASAVWSQSSRVTRSSPPGFTASSATRAIWACSFPQPDGRWRSAPVSGFF